MANVGFFFNTQIPDLDDDANIQDALRQYHYGGGASDNEDPASIVADSVAGHLQSIADKFEDVLTYYRTAGAFSDTEPTGTPSGTSLDVGVPDGYVWVDSSASGGPSTRYFAAAYYTNEAPTADLSDGVIWIDKDSALSTAYVYDANTSSWIAINDFANAVSSKGDMLVGDSSAELDSLSVGSDGSVLTADSSASLGVSWQQSNIDDHRIGTIMGIY